MSPRYYNIFKINIFLFVVIGLALFLRLWGINHDLPYNYYPDERHFINRSLAFGSGDLNPHWFHKPALYMYILFFEYGVYFLIGRALSWFNSVDDFARYYFTDPTAFFLLGRTTTTLFGVATVYLTYLVGKKYGSERIGLLAALFLAVTFGHVRSSHFALTDVPTTFFSVLSFLFLVKIVDTGRFRYYLLAGLFAGLGTATKYYSITLLPSLYLAHILFHWSQNRFWWKKIIDTKIIGGFAMWGFGFFLGSPYNFLDPFWFRTHILPMFTGKGGTVADKSVFQNSGQTPLAILQIWDVIFSPMGMGIVLGFLSLVGVVYLCFRHSLKDLVLFSAPLIFILIAAFTNPFYSQGRHLNPIYPFLCLAAAVIVDKVLNVGWLKRQSWVAALVCFLSIAPSVYQAVKFNYVISQKETRTLAKEWVEGNIPEGAKIVLDAHGPALNWSVERLRELYEKAKKETRPGPFTTHLERYFHYQMEAAGGVTYDILQINHAWWKEKEEVSQANTIISDRDLDFGNPIWGWGVMSFDFYRSSGYQYIITTSEDYAIYMQEPRKSNFPSTYAFYRDLFEKGIMVKEFRPEPWNHSGPVVKIFKI